jgi:adenylate cyclase
MREQTTSVGMERKLAAIFSTDVAGYSRLMGDDEEATIHTLIAYRAVISSLIHQYRGRVVDAPGDNLLAEFASVVDAVTAVTPPAASMASRGHQRIAVPRDNPTNTRSAHQVQSERV